MKTKGLILALAVASVTANAQGKAHLSGTINGLNGGYAFVVQSGDDYHVTDTLKVNDDGTFNADINLRQPIVAYLHFEKQKLSKKIFLEDGMKATVNATVVKNKDNKEEPYSLVFNYQGDNKDCFEFEERNNIMSDFERWPWEYLETIKTFREYRTEYLAYSDSLKAECCKTKSLAYRRIKLKEIDSYINSSLARYAWRKNYQPDSDLSTWMLSFDHNDPNDIEAIYRYFRWYEIANPTPEGTTCFSQIRNAFSNQEIKNKLADVQILQLLQNAPENMEQLLADYKATSTNKAGHEKADQTFNHYNKMKKGMPAVDFTFYDAKGKKYSLKDFRGKALYIDVWATWCGPCCAEIPYMEKLVEKFKNDKRINLISISFDENEKKWLDKLAEDKPKWKQFRCPDHYKSSLCREYDINGIPRFLMFDAEGNIVSLDAPRPSDSRIEEWIKKALSTSNSTQPVQEMTYDFESLSNNIYNNFIDRNDTASYEMVVYNGIKQAFGNDIVNRSRFVADYLHSMYFRHPSPIDCRPTVDKYLQLCVVDSVRQRINRDYENFYNNYNQIFPGKIAPDFTFADPDGKIYRLSDFKGQLVVVDIWGTWCAPCKEEMPHLRKVYDKYKDDSRVKIISIACDKKTDVWKQYIKEHPEPWQQFIVTNEGDKILEDTYHVWGIPRFMLIGSDGLIVKSDSLRPSFAAEFDKELSNAL